VSPLAINVRLRYGDVVEETALLLEQGSGFVLTEGRGKRDTGGLQSIG